MLDHARARSRLTTALAMGCGWLATLAVPPVLASELTWDAPSSCAERDQLSFQIERAIGEPLAQSGQLDFYVRVESTGAKFSALLRVTSPRPGSHPMERVLAAGSCSMLVDTLVVAIALALDAERDRPTEAATPASSTASATPADVAPTSPVPVVDAPPVPESESVRGLQPSVFAGIVGDVGSLPSPALGAALGVELGASRLHLRAFATLFFDQRARVASSEAFPSGADLSLVFGTVLACAEPFGARPSAAFPALCAGLDVGRLQGVGRAVLESRQRAVLWLEPRLDAALFWHVPETQLRLNALLGMAVPLNRDTFILDDIGTVHRPSRVVGRAGAGIELLF